MTTLPLSPRLWLLLPVVIGLGSALRAEDAPAIRFGIDVRAALSKGGCNAGACHGNQNGKGGFKLSLRGEDPAFDYRALTREGGRRVNLLAPQESLLLLKPTLAVAHEGGLRFRPDARPARILRTWIEAGASAPRAGEPHVTDLVVEPRERVIVAPEDHVPLRVMATFSDGRQEDVTDLAVFEPTNLVVAVDAGGIATRRQWGETTILVRFINRQVAVQLAFLPATAAPVGALPPAAGTIDRLIDAKLAKLRLVPAPSCDDAAFVRRVHLDLCGVLPTAEEARAFLADPRPDKRAALIDALLVRPEFADFWALKFADLLRTEEKVLDVRGVEVYHRWLRESLAAGRPLDQMVRDLLTGIGSTYDNPPANYYRANREPFVRAETTARLFLGARLQCAKCHNHPYDRWTQDDYYGWAANFARIDYKIGDNPRKDKLDKHEFVGEQWVQIPEKGDVTNARTGQPARMRLLGQPGDAEEGGDRLARMADWVTRGQERTFAQVQANFVWYHLLGRGLVEPIDDFRSTNPPVNPALLDALADELIAARFDIKHLVRAIALSRTYQAAILSETSTAETDASVAEHQQSAAAANFARAIVRRLTAEQLVDAQSQVLLAPARFNDYPEGTRAAQIAGTERARGKGNPPGDGDRMLKLFGRPMRLLACECERSNETTLAQAMSLVSGAALQERLVRPGNRLEQLAASGRPASELLSELYWTALTREPTAAERAAYEPLLANASEMDRLAEIQDLVWALLNSKEFLFRH